MPADPKPKTRVRADLKDWEMMRQLLKDNPCQVCGRRYPVPGRSVHHIVPKSQGGDDELANLSVLCGHGTVGCHGDVEARRNGARERLRENMTLEQKEYVWTKRGTEWLERHYPPLEGGYVDPGSFRTWEFRP